MNICFFCASSEQLGDSYYSLAENFGEKIAQNSWTLVTGGSNIGLMRVLTKSVVKNKGKSIGIIPSLLEQRGLACFDNSELIITSDMQERKKVLFDISDAFIILPGGFGTLDELMEILTLKMLGVYDKPIVIFNLNGFYDVLIKHFDLIFAENFAFYANKDAYFVSDDVDKTIEYLKNYKQKNRQ